MSASPRPIHAPSPRAGEIVVASVPEFEAQCPRLHDAPPLGTLVRVQPGDELTLFAVVAGSTTDGVDVGARPVLRGRDGLEDADVYREHPDLAYVLRTCFQCLVVGYQAAGRVFHHLPPIAAPIHYSVAVCSDAEVQRFTEQLDYLRILLDARNVPSEEVLAAHIRCSAQASPDAVSPYTFAVRAGREVATLLKSDHQRLVSILQRIRPLTSPTIVPTRA